MKEKSGLFSMTSCSLMAALMCALCPLALPIGPIPVSLGTFIMMLTVYLLGTRRSLISCAVYLLLGAVGMPVFSGYHGGISKLVGPTGGFLFGYLGLVIVAGLILRLGKRKLSWAVLAMALGMTVNYICGTVWFSVQTASSLRQAFDVCVLPFIPVDVLKIGLAIFLGRLIRLSLLRANLL